MSPVTTLFFDVGGVLLTNAWDRHARERAAAEFDLDRLEFADRHEQVVAAFETGGITEAQYLDRTVFHRSRPFSRDEFRAFVYKQSRRLDDGALEVVDALRRRGDLLLCTLNNESADLNAWRLREFGLLERFRIFVSSCHVRLRKPDAAIYRMALDLVQQPATSCVFIDDRPINTQCARLLGMHCIDYAGVEDVRERLAELGLET